MKSHSTTNNLFTRFSLIALRDFPFFTCKSFKLISTHEILKFRIYFIIQTNKRESLRQTRMMMSDTILFTSLTT